MPELPEVETIVRKLKNNVIDQTILDIDVTQPKIIEYPSADEFCKRLKNQVIHDINRRGKYIIFTLDDGMNLVAHMRMTGRLYVSPTDKPFEKHTHLVMDLGDSLSIRFSDSRRFGRFWLVDDSELEDVTGISNLGLEPLDENLTGDYLRSKIRKSKKAVKTILLEQTVIAGIGNIYADEILHRAGILPMKRVVDMQDYEFDNLAKAIPEVIKENIEVSDQLNDTSLLNLLDYKSSPSIKIYNHYGTPCPNCGKELTKTKVNGRNTTYCSNCQH